MATLCFHLLLCHPSTHAPEDGLSLWARVGHAKGNCPTALPGLSFDVGGLDVNQETNTSYPQMKEQLRTTTFLIKDKCKRS